MKDLQKIGPVGILTGVVYAGLLAGIYYSTFKWLAVKDWARDDYSASMLIPLVAIYLIWEKRGALSHIPSKGSWVGILVMVVGFLLLWMGELGGEYFSIYYSSWLLLVGLCLLHLGWRKLKVIAFPIVLLLAMFPLPHFIHGKLSFQLKLVSSHLGVKMMQWLGMTAYREGNVIDLGFTQLQVVDACSGLRYLIPLIILGLIIAYYYRGVWWKRGLLVLSTIPIAVLVNSLRIASVGVLYPVWGPKVAEGFFHDFSGWFIFMLTVGFLMFFMWVLKKLPPRRPKPAKDSVDSSGKEFAAASYAAGGVNDAQSKKGGNQLPAESSAILRDLAAPKFIAAGCLLAVTLAISLGVEFHEKLPMNRPLSEFPVSSGGWQGKRVSMEQKFIDTLDLSDYVIIDYQNGDGRAINFYVAYYQSQRKGESIHSPATCMPGGGWLFRESGKALVPLNSGENSTMSVNRAFMQKGESKQLAYYWFPMRGRVLTNAYEMKLYNFWDALTRQRTDGALVRVITPIYVNEALEQAEARLQKFMNDMVPVLDDFLPK